MGIVGRGVLMLRVGDGVENGPVGVLVPGRESHDPFNAVEVFRCPHAQRPPRPGRKVVADFRKMPGKRLLGR